MAGALSGHILDSFYSPKSQNSGPFGMPINPSFNDSTSSWPTSTDNIITSGAMSFDKDMHGSAQKMHLLSDFSQDPTFLNLSKATAAKIAALQAKLNQQLGPEYISTRPGPGGGPKLVYAEGWKIINLANEVFGFNGWSSNLVNLTTDFIDYNEETRRYSVGVTVVMRVTLRDGVFHEDVGYGVLENSKSKGPALDKCKKEAVTDALKRCLRNFGNLLGNCLYDKQYTNEIVKVKVTPPKFDKDKLHRRPEYANDTHNADPSSATSNPSKPASSSTNAPVSTVKPEPVSSKPTSSSTSAPVSIVKSEPVSAKPLSSIPPHVRQQVRGASSSSTASASSSKATIPIPNTNVTPAPGTSSRGSTSRTAAIMHGLNTPITPGAQPIPPPPGPAGPNNRQVAFADSPLAHRAPVAAPDPAPLSEPLDDDGGGDDSFAYGSEDDAFFASVDLGEVDMGRPINFEESVGSKDSKVSTSTSTWNQNAQTDSSHTSADSDARRNHPQQQSSHHQAQRPASNISRTADPIYYGNNSTNGSNHGVPQAQGSSTIGTPSTFVPRRMGGFTFPPEMQNIGVKRSADAMRTTFNPGPAQPQPPRERRLAPGMGLMAAQGTIPDRGDGGDVKRVRR
ncbi:hypothetical protein D9757_004219 [Collybiopsis confluens]|uniref:Uncharacterized protein n=1 Tax=Collybiopsis confluens TaxID=2823264 RepID=A0A8H5HU40_9AGAR|nr:hypothetical protein D9757_004219 [Collybiopsis confluens]